MTNDGRGPLAEELRSVAVPVRAIIALCSLSMAGYAVLLVWSTVSGYEPFAVNRIQMAEKLVTTALWLAVFGAAWRVAGRLSAGGEVFSTRSLADLRLMLKLLAVIVCVSLGCGLALGKQADLFALGVGCVLGVFIAYYEYGCILQRQDDETI